MNKEKIFMAALLASIPFSIVGALLKIMHWPGGQLSIGIAVFLTLVYIVLGLSDIFSRPNLRPGEKIMWVAGFLFMPFIAGVMYYFGKIRK